MNRWLYVAAGVVALTVFRRPHRRGTSLVPPLDGTITTTPHGQFGAPRKGPPVHTHQGVDLAATPGTFVRAIGNGVIVATNPGLGLLVRKLRLDEPAAFSEGKQPIAFVVYADLGSALREPGERVKAGEPVAVVGARGFFHFACKRLVAGGEQFFDPADAGFVSSNQQRSVA